MIAFDFARTFNPSTRVGTATGIVNIGGFAASLLSMYLIGIVLDILLASGFSEGGLYSLPSFRLALSTQLLFLALGVGAMLVVRRRVRRQLAAQGVVVPPIRQAVARERARRRQGRALRRHPGSPGGRNTGPS